MNAKSERASLPDRVEAAARAMFKQETPAARGLDESNLWFDDPAAQELFRRLAGTAVAAADACEAERNPNTTDDALEQVGWMSAGVWSPMGPDSLHDKYPNLNGYEVIWRPVYARRRVSSEDVHREATE